MPLAKPSDIAPIIRRDGAVHVGMILLESYTTFPPVTAYVDEVRVRCEELSVKAVHALQDAIKVDQPNGPGKFEVPKWDPVSQKKVREALIVLATTLTDTSRAFGTADQVDPVERLISAAATWGGNPKKDAIYLTVTPQKNDGNTNYRLNVRDVPVDGFWSISLYNADGYFQRNAYDAYSLNNITAKKSADGSVAIQFGDCDGKIPNCLPIMKGWNYTVRLYRPREEILNGKWTFPEAQPVN